MFRNPSADVLIVLVIVLLFFGPKRLPSLGKSLGSGIREFKDSITGNSKDDDEEAETEKPALAQASAAASAPAAQASTPHPAETGGSGAGSEQR